MLYHWGCMANLSDRPYTWRRVGLVYLGTTAFCSAIAILLWLLGAAEPLWASFVISFCIGYSINTTSLLLTPIAERYLPAMPANVLTTVLGLLGGLMLAGWLIIGQPAYFLSDDDYSAIVLGLFFGAIGITYFATRERLHVAETELADVQAMQLRNEKQHLETQLKLLQAQIEPHFLFNTLSNVIGMIHDKPDDAEQTLLHLTTLFRASLKRTREPLSRLADELEIITALLEISQIRMGSRLRYSIEVDDSLLDISLPPLLLQPLVENSLKHGIEPLEAGGEITLQINKHNDQLIIRIADTGCGFGAASNTAGSGTGVANVQARLSALFGGAASLALEERQPTGVVATLILPAPASAA